MLTAGYGCQPHAAIAQAPHPAPPYTLVEGGQLQVRGDLFQELRFARVERTDLHASLRGVGQVAFAPGASYAVRTAVPAFVERVFVSVGQSVARGTPLALLRSPEVARLRGDRRRLQVELALARDEVLRLERLVPEGAASERELVSARSRISSLQAEGSGVSGSLAAAGATSGAGDAFTLRASSPGVVIARSVDPGERVDPAGAEPAFLVGDPTAVVVRASFPEREAPLLVAGAPCTFVVSALGGDRHEGELSQVVQAIDPNTHTAAASCRPRVVDPRLRPEMVARVEIEARGAPALIVPRGAVLLRHDERVVFVRRGPDRLERRAVDVGTTFGDHMQLLHGIADGEEVVTDNAVLLDGTLDQLL